MYEEIIITFWRKHVHFLYCSKPYMTTRVCHFLLVKFLGPFCFLILILWIGQMICCQHGPIRIPEKSRVIIVILHVMLYTITITLYSKHLYFIYPCKSYTTIRVFFFKFILMNFLEVFSSYQLCELNRWHAVKHSRTKITENNESCNYCDFTSSSL